MFDLYSNLKHGYSSRKIEVDELLFAEFTCLNEEAKLGIWSANNYFAFITNGKKKWKSINHTYEVQNGDVIFVKKGANFTHHYFDDEFCAILIFIPDDFIRAVISKYTLFDANANSSTQDSVITVAPDELLRTYYSSLKAYLSLTEGPDKQLLKLKFEELLLSLFSNKIHKNLTDYFMSLCQSREYLMSEVVERNFAYDLRLQDYAQLCNMSESTFRRCFVKHYKVTPALWIQNRKLELAHYKLLSSNLSIDQIALESGFEETSYFIKIFKQKYNYTPSRYRQNQLRVS